MTMRLATTPLRPLLVVVALAALAVAANTFRFQEDCTRPQALRDTSALPGTTDAAERESRYEGSVFQWLVDAWRHYDQVCAP